MNIFITQPCYLSWAGYYSFLDACDTFIIYDDIQFVHQSWHHRNRIKGQNGSQWLTVPIVRNEGQIINDVKINGNHWNKDHWKTIQQNYVKAPYFKQYQDIYTRIYEMQWNKLVNLNITLMLETARQLKIKIPQIIRSSDIEVSGDKTDRLLCLLKYVKADTYLSSVGAKSYLDVKSLNNEGIEVKWCEYNNPVYPQRYAGFVPYLSVLDLLLNVGDESVKYLRQGLNLVKA